MLHPHTVQVSISRSFETKILTNHLTYDPILINSSPAEIVRFAKTCKSAHAAVTSYFRRAYNFNRRLEKFFRSPSSFRSLQAATGILVSGAVALDFFNRETTPDSLTKLELYVSIKYLHEVQTWLLEEGYNPAPDWEKVYGKQIGLDDIERVLLFVKYSTDHSNRKPIQVSCLLTSDGPLEAILSLRCSKSTYHVVYLVANIHLSQLQR